MGLRNEKDSRLKKTRTLRLTISNAVYIDIIRAISCLYLLILSYYVGRYNV